MILRKRNMALVCLLAAVGCASQRPRSRLREEDAIQFFKVTSVGGQVFLRGEVRRQDQEYGVSEIKTSEDDKFLEEGIDLLTSGYFYHPNLIDWDADFRLSLSQERVEIDGMDFDTDGTLLGYDLSAIILKQKPVSLRLFAADTRDVLDRHFARRVELQRVRRGVELLAKGPFPLSVLLEEIELTEESDIRMDRQDTKRLSFSIADRRDRDWFTEFTYEHEDTDETSVFLPAGGGVPVVQDLPVELDELTLSNRWRFGSGPRKSSLLGRVRYLDRRGFFPNKVLTAEPRLDLVHSDTFSTFYSCLFNLDKTDVEEDRTVHGETGFSKSIYDSLDVAGRLLGTNREFEDGSEDILGGFLDLRYRKKTPIGRFTSSLRLGREHQEEEATVGKRSVRNEAVTLTGVTFSQLSQPNVVPGTILVTNLSETIIYVENVDYIVQTIGVFTEIARRLGGSIVDGQTVLVDYVAQVGPEATFSTDHLNCSNRIKLEALPVSLYFDYLLRKNNLLSGEDPGNLETQLIKLLGIELDYKGLTVAAEHEIENRDLSPPSTSNRLRLRYQRRLRPGVDLSVGGQAERLQYGKASEFGLEPGRDFLDTIGGNARLTAKLARNLLMRLQGDYFRTRGRDNSRRAGVSLGLEGTYRSLDFSAELRHDIFEQELNDGTTTLFRISVSRRF